jgi:hypothetical protein
MISELILLAQLGGLDVCKMPDIPAEVCALARQYRDKGEIIEGHHCPVAGKGDGECIEWCGDAPPIGATESCTPEAPKVEVTDE